MMTNDLPWVSLNPQAAIQAQYSLLAFFFIAQVESMMSAFSGMSC